MSENVGKPKLKKDGTPKRSGGARPNAGGPRPNSGREAFVPTEEERKKVAEMSGHGVPIHQIAVLVRNGIHVDTLRKHFELELVAGKADANSKVGNTLFEKVMSGDTTAMIWWTKTQMGWKETKAVEHTSPDGSMTPKDNNDAVLAALARKYADD